MKNNKVNLLPGAIDLSVFKFLYGLCISCRIEQMAKGTFQVKPDSLFLALHRIEEVGWFDSLRGESENNCRAKFYRLTKAGGRQFKSGIEGWQRMSLSLAKAPQTR